MALINDSGEIRRIIRPLAKGWWFILLMSILGAYQGYKSFQKEPPSYQARATIQVNDKNSSSSTFLENFEAFSLVGEFLLELELIRSTYLIRKAIQKIPVKTAYWKMETHGWAQQYKSLPFTFLYHFEDSSWLDKPFLIDIHPDQSWDLRFEETIGNPAQFHMQAEDSATYRDLRIQLHNPDPARKLNPGTYQVIVRSEEKLMEIFADMDNLLVRLQDEKVAIINIYYWHTVSALATDFVNALAQTYIENFLDRKREMANRVLESLELQISLATRKLLETEANLYDYKDEVNIWDVNSFRKLHLDILSETETRKLNLQLKIEDLENMSRNLRLLKRNQLAEINYGSIRDGGFQDALEQIVKLQDELKKLSGKLSGKHPKIKILKRIISQTIEEVDARTRRTLITHKELLQKLEMQVATSTGQIMRLPGIEQNLEILQRKVEFRQRNLDSLNLKMINANISVSADFSFHRILEHELPPEHPIKPLVHIKVGVNSLMYTLYGIFILLFVQGIKGIITHQDDVAEYLEMPIRMKAELRPFPYQAISQGIINLATDLILDKKVQILTLIDFKSHPDKIFSGFQLAYTLAVLDKKTLLLTAKDAKPFIREKHFSHQHLDILPIGNEKDDFPLHLIHHKDWDNTLSQLCKQYQFIIYIVQGLEEIQDPLPFMLQSDLNLYVARSLRSKFSHVQNVQEYLQKSGIEKTELLLLTKPIKTWFSRLLSRLRGNPQLKTGGQ